MSFPSRTERTGAALIPGFLRIVVLTRAATSSTKAHAVKHETGRHPELWGHTLPGCVVAGIKPLTYPRPKRHLPDPELSSCCSVQVAANPGPARTLSQGGLG